MGRKLYVSVSLVKMPVKTIAVIRSLDADLIMVTSRFPNEGERVMAERYMYTEAPGRKANNWDLSF